MQDYYTKKVCDKDDKKQSHRAVTVADGGADEVAGKSNFYFVSLS